jgi:hypothetical protein
MTLKCEDCERFKKVADFPDGREQGICLDRWGTRKSGWYVWHNERPPCGGKDFKGQPDLLCVHGRKGGAFCPHCKEAETEGT